MACFLCLINSEKKCKKQLHVQFEIFFKGSTLKRLLGEILIFSLLLQKLSRRAIVVHSCSSSSSSSSSSIRDFCVIKGVYSVY